MNHRRAYKFALLIGLLVFGVVLVFVPVPAANEKYLTGILGGLLGALPGIGGGEKD